MKIKSNIGQQDLHHDLDGSPKDSLLYPPTSFLEEREDLNGEAWGGESKWKMESRPAAPEKGNCHVR
jgi:hypothetical protein